MTDQNHYAKLGVDESSSFEEIQDARNFLVQEHGSDRRQIEAIEAAYDAILMDRLRLRQEGKIKVPDRIRFPERLIEPPSAPASLPQKPTPDWIKRLIDTPSRADVLLPAGLFLTTALLSLSFPPVALAVGVGFSFYFLNRKERKFGRSLLLTIAGLVGGVFLGLQLAGFLAPQLANLALSPETFAAIVTFFVLWLISSFLR